ncbi:MAG TPA: hypothetical protein VL793_00175, partial [Patescibacteria group bacterium]|nr:hypothetical protein [Patescibacteria group bacterium]
MNGPIPLVQKKLGKTPSVPADSSRAHNPLRAPSNTTLVEEAARKALSAQELAETLERFRRLCRSTNAQPAQLDETAEVLRNAGFKQELMRLLREALSETGINPHVGALWIRRVVNSKVWDRRYPAGLDALCKQGEVGRRAVIEFLEEAGRKRRIELVLTAVSRHRKWLRREPQGWAAVVRALTRVRCYSKAVQWMAGWRDQGPLDLPTLHCLALALRATGQTQASKEVVNLALQNSEAAALFPIFILWTAQDQAFAGDTQGASATFKQI